MSMAVFSIAVRLFCKPVRVYFIFNERVLFLVSVRVFCGSVRVCFLLLSVFSFLMRVCFVYQLRVHFACYFRQCFMRQCVYCESVFCISVRLFCESVRVCFVCR